MSILINIVLILLLTSFIYSCYVSQNATYTIVLNKVDVYVYKLTSNRKRCSNISGIYSGYCSSVQCEISITNFNSDSVIKIFTERYDRRLNSTGKVCRIQTKVDVDANLIYLPRKKKFFYSRGISYNEDIYVWEYKANNYLKLYQNFMTEWRSVHEKSEYRVLEFTSGDIKYSVKVLSNNLTPNRKLLALQPTETSIYTHKNLSLYLSNSTCPLIRKCWNGLPGSYKQPKQSDGRLPLPNFSSLKETTPYPPTAAKEVSPSVYGSSSITDGVTLERSDTGRPNATQFNTNQKNEQLSHRASRISNIPKDDIGSEHHHFQSCLLVIIISASVLWLVVIICGIFCIVFTKKRNKTQTGKFSYKHWLRSNVIKYCLHKKFEDNDDEIIIFEQKPYSIDYISKGNFI